jgi:phosphatidylinositol alpha-1,6-mannosyltransferase
MLRSIAARRYHGLFQSCDGIFALTEAEREHWSAELPGRAVHLCSHGVSVMHGSCTDRASAERRLRQRYGAGPMIASVGRVSAHKNQAVLIDAMPLIRRRVPTARLLLVGPSAGAEAVSLRRRAAGLPDRDAVVFTGPVSDLELCDVYAGSFCVAHPSRHEASGLTPLESIAHGTPAIHSGQGALARFDHLPGCRTVRSLTDPVPWSEAILDCLEESGEWRRQAAMGRATVLSRHTWQAMGARIATAVEAITGDAVSSTVPDR